MRRKLVPHPMAVRRDPWDDHDLYEDDSPGNWWVKEFECGVKRRHYVSAATAVLAPR